MRDTMEYKIIRIEGSVEELESMVNEAIEAGWIPMGGVAVAMPGGPGGGMYYLQSMTRKIK
jgi:TRAP-type C4-dicarboxylate transport system permease small subunit